MKHGVWLPWKPWSHLDSRVVNHAKVVHINHNTNVDHCMDGSGEEWYYQEALKKQIFKRAHSNQWVCCWGVIPVMLLVEVLIEPRCVEHLVCIVRSTLHPQKEQWDWQCKVQVSIFPNSEVHAGVVAISNPTGEKSRYTWRYCHVYGSNDNLVDFVFPRQESMWLTFPFLGIVSLQSVVIELKESTDHVVHHLWREYCHHNKQK